MAISYSQARPLLLSGDLPRLFIDVLGWDRARGVLNVVAGGRDWSLTAVAQKRGMVVYKCEPADDGDIPDRALRALIESQVAASVFEHVVVFSNSGRTLQIWQWVRREPGRPLARREQRLEAGQSGEALLQKLQVLAFSLDEEDEVTLADVTGRARAAFDVDRITRRFFDQFKAEHSTFLSFITGISNVADQAWYGSLMLNRLMFAYFIQKKGLLDGNSSYLRDRLLMVQQSQGAGNFLSFYRYFLRRLFHEGFGQEFRDAEQEGLLGRVPYLNGGLFDVHDLEKLYPDLDIADEAFVNIFDFFDAYEWHLDTRPLRTDNEINPDVLGYIFEKYINQKELGAYYTKEDITGYITGSTMLPVILDRVREECAIAFRPDGLIWTLLQQHPSRYVPLAMRHGVDLQLPPAIAAGLSDPLGRTEWNQLADPLYGLPSETWREHMARRQRYDAIIGRIKAPAPLSTADFITLNLDLHQFLQDVIDNAEGPEVVRSFYKTLRELSVLDPTCGSGAFLFAALNLLEPLYDGCLERMEVFLAEAKSHTVDGLPLYKDFHEALDEVGRHPNRRYFILKTVIIDNLYGVDIIEEATEICKLRLFLKLIAQVTPDFRRPNHGLEALPDIDFNIRCGNTLVGFVDRAEVSDAFSESAQGSLLLGENLAEVERQADRAERAFTAFNRLQRSELPNSSELKIAKKELNEQLAALNAELDRYLADQYSPGVSRREAEFRRWRTTHQPFHWFVAFHAIVGRGGFDAIIGNPPYIELDEVDDYQIRGYKTESCGNLYALVLERCMRLGSPSGRGGFIVPVSSVSTDRYEALQTLLLAHELHYSNFDDRPSRLFDGLEHIRLTIHLIGPKTPEVDLHSTRYNKWAATARPVLFQTLRYADVKGTHLAGSLPKLTSELEPDLLARLYADQAEMRNFYAKSEKSPVFYSRKIGYFLQVLDFEPLVLDGAGRRRPPSEFKALGFSDPLEAKLALAALNSSLFYWFVTVFSDCRHVNKREVDAFPINLRRLATEPHARKLAGLADQLMADLRSHSANRVMKFRHDTLTVQCIFPRHSKGLIDEIDRELGIHYGFTDEQVDFLINYDIKFRVGLVAPVLE